ncbi:hypothetical protein Tco_0932330, partial [Tanacetum coccineum]
VEARSSLNINIRVTRTAGLAKGGSDLGANLNAKRNDGYSALYRVAMKGGNRTNAPLG